MNIPEPYLIIDLRQPSEFKGVTISGFKRMDVVTIFQNSMINNKLEDALKWCVEMHISGMNSQIWDSLFQVYIKHVNCNNPRFYLYYLKRLKDYDKIISKGYPPKKHEIFTRNDQEIRHIFSELTAILTLTKKNGLFIPKSLPKLDKTFYSKETIQKHMIAKSADKIYDFVHIQQDKDIILALNEILHNLLSKRQGTFSNCIYWYMWIERVEQMKRKDNLQPIVFDTKDVKPVDGIEEEHWSMWIWSLWEIIFYAMRDKSEQKQFFINKMYEDFKRDFKPVVVNKKKYLFFFSFYLFKNHINWDSQMINQEFMLIQTCANINTLYREVKLHLEKDLCLDERNTLNDEYSTLHQQFIDRLSGGGFNKPMKEIEPLRNTCISQVDPTKYPHLKQLSRINFEEENIPIEYHHMIEEQARIVEKEIQDDIERGHRSRRTGMEEVESKVERVRKNGYKNVDNEETDPDKIRQNYKLDLYSQFIAYKNDDKPRRNENENEVLNYAGKTKKIEFQNRNRHRRRRRERDNDDMDEEDEDD